MTAAEVRHHPPRSEAAAPATAATDPLLCPFTLQVDPVAAFLNAELADHPVYDGIELQRFDDRTHGTGLLAFLSRREDRRVDYYVGPGLRLDRARYHIGGGTGRWVDTTFAASLLEVTALGVHADVRFTDVDGRPVTVRVDDRLAGRRRPAVLLAPFGAGIDAPTSLMLVHLHGFDLVRRVRPDPEITVDGEVVDTGRLPGVALHRRHLIKYAAPLSTALVCPAVDEPLAAVDPAAPGGVRLSDDGRAFAGVLARDGSASAELVLDPPVPNLTDLPLGQLRTGLWHVNVDGATVTGGTWRALRRHDHVELGLDVLDRWQPQAGLPPLFRLVTRVVPTFRRWPTTYRWRAVVSLGQDPRLVSRWERTDSSLADAYRRATGT